MNYKHQILLITTLYLIAAVNANSQQNNYPIRFWDIQMINGLIGTEGEYKYQNIFLRNSYKDKLKNSTITGQLILNTQSYFYHPNLLTLETNFQFNPGTRKNIYLVIPDRTDIVIGESVRGNVRFLQSLPINLSAFSQYSHIFTNREYTTDLESNNFSYGGIFNYRNKVAPINLSFQDNKMSQTELRTNRKYLNDRTNIKLNSSFEFSKMDENKLSASFDSYKNEYSNLHKISSNISTFTFNTVLKLDSSAQNKIFSNILYSQNQGYIDYEKYQLAESFLYFLEKKLKLLGNFNYNKMVGTEFINSQQNINFRLEHELFKSVKSHIFFENIRNNQSFSNEQLNNYGSGVLYSKKIPKGILTLSYNYSKQNVEKKNFENNLLILNEKIVLTNTEITILSNPFIDVYSIIIKSLTNDIIYRENIDYILIRRDNFLEVQRLPGGLIEDGSEVFVDYRAETQPSYKYDSYSSTFYSSISLLENLFEFYFRLLSNNYYNINTTYANILKITSQKVFGIKINYKFITAGFELDNYESNIVPLKSKRYYLRAGSKLFDNLSLSITGNLKFVELLEDKNEQEFHDINSMINYRLTSNLDLKLETNHRVQKGMGMNLDLGIFRGELRFNYREFYFSFGAESYNRNFIEEKINYIGGFIRLQRKF
ncbi:MAG: hypothetical protein IPH62_06490 [Ignavibacteriae bacterium]|nr:hypothetical protein [Ignavibacteriota bacterium]